MKPRLPAPRTAWSALIAVAALAAGACGGAGEPVARLSVEPASLTLPYPGSGRLQAVWQPLEPLAAGDAPHVFVHLLDAPRSVLRTFDHPFPGRWSPGETVEAPLEVWQSALAPPLAPGTYQLTVGLYDPASGRRWRLEAPGEEVDRQEYAVARVEVPAEAVAGPEITFSESWLPLQPTGDHQLFAMRWLGGDDGWISLEGFDRPLALCLSLNVVRLEEEGYRLVLDPGEEVPRVRITSGCGGEMATVEGFGRHDVVLPLVPAAPAAPEAGCTAHLDPNFVFLDVANFTRRAVRLDRLHWSELEPKPGP